MQLSKIEKRHFFGAIWGNFYANEASSLKSCANIASSNGVIWDEFSE